MKRIGDFIYGMFSEGCPESSKRVFGGIGFICAIVFIAIWRHDLFETLLYVSASLLGLSAVVGMFNKTNNKVNLTDKNKDDGK